VTSHVKALSKIIFTDLVGSVVWFPVWWYSRGLFGVIAWVGRELKYRIRAYSFRVWIKNFFVPMYGQYDWMGRIISVFMRFFVLIGRAIGFVLEAIFYGVLIAFWAIFPVATLLLFLMSAARGTFFEQVSGLL